MTRCHRSKRFNTYGAWTRRAGHRSPSSDRRRLSVRHQLLEAQFGQKHKVINAYMEALIDIDTPTDSLPSLRLFRDMEYMPGDIHT